MSSPQAARRHSVALRSLWRDPRTIACPQCRALLTGQRRLFVTAAEMARVDRVAWADAMLEADRALVDLLDYGDETRGRGGRRRLLDRLAPHRRGLHTVPHRRRFPIDEIDLQKVCAALAATLVHAWDWEPASTLRHLEQLQLHRWVIETVRAARSGSLSAARAEHLAQRAIANFLEVKPRTVRRILAERRGLWAAKANATKMRRRVARILR